MPAQNCPNCGANLDAKALNNGRCGYCGTTLTPPKTTSRSSEQSPQQAEQNTPRKRRVNRGFVFLWLFACFAMGISMVQSGVDGPIKFIPFIMGIVGASQMLRRDTSGSEATSKRQRRHRNNRGNDR